MCLSLWRVRTPLNQATLSFGDLSIVTPTLLYGCETWTLFAQSDKRTQAFETKRPRSSASPTWSIEPTTKCRPRSTSLWVHRNLFNETCMVGVCRTLRQDTLEGGRRRSRRRITSKSGLTSLSPMPELLTMAPCTEKTGRGSLLNRPPRPPDDPQSGKGPN